MPIPNYNPARRGFRPLEEELNAPDFGDVTAVGGGLANGVGGGAQTPGFYDPNTGVWVGNPSFDNPNPGMDFPAGGGEGGFGTGGYPTDESNPTGSQIYLPPDWNPTGTSAGDSGSGQQSGGPTYDPGGGGGGASDNPSDPGPAPPPTPSGPTLSQNTPATNPRPGEGRTPPTYPQTGGYQVWGAPPRPAPGGPTYTGPPQQQRPPAGLQTWGGTPRPSPQPVPPPSLSPSPAPAPSLPTPTPTGSSGSSSSGSVGLGVSQQPSIAGIPGPLNYNFQPIQDNPSTPMGGTPNYAGMANYGFNPQSQNRGQGQQQGQSGTPNYNGGYVSQGLNALGVNSPNWLRAALSLGGL